MPRTIRGERCAGQCLIGMGVSFVRAVHIWPAEELAGVRKVQKYGARPATAGTPSLCHVARLSRHFATECCGVRG
jgi:hypothetical protein